MIKENIKPVLQAAAGVALVMIVIAGYKKFVAPKLAKADNKVAVK